MRRARLIGTILVAVLVLAGCGSLTPVTEQGREVRDLYNVLYAVAAVVFVLVEAAIVFAAIRYRRRSDMLPPQFHGNNLLEVVWTVVPVVLLAAMAFPATSKLIQMYDTRDSEMTVKVTGYQWMWKYEYLGEGVSFTSRLDRKSDQIRQSGKDARDADHPHYLLDVDNVLVLPTETKIRFVITADDVIHAWWVPALGWKQDAIPGIVNEAWTDIKEPGIYRGQCAELCGKDHGFMPIVVKAVPKAEFQQWPAAEKAKTAPAPAAPAAQPAAPEPAQPQGTTPNTEATAAAAEKQAPVAG